MAELENLPYGLSVRPPIAKVRDLYVSSFRDFRAFPKVTDATDEQKFTELLQKIYARHMNVVQMMAMGVAGLRDELQIKMDLNDLPEIHQFLDGFYLSRIGIRMLIGQHVALKKECPSDHIGMICIKTSPLQVATDAIRDARAICSREYGTAPEVEIFCPKDLTFPYVPGHLHHMLCVRCSFHICICSLLYTAALQSAFRACLDQRIKKVLFHTACSAGSSCSRTACERCRTDLRTRTTTRRPSGW